MQGMQQWQTSVLVGSLIAHADGTTVFVTDTFPIGFVFQRNDSQQTAYLPAEYGALARDIVDVLPLPSSPLL